jgi:hypothetical protein
MKPVNVRKNEVAIDDLDAPAKIALEDGAEEKILPSIVNARRLLSGNPEINSINVAFPIKVYEFDENDQEVSDDSVFIYIMDVTRDSVYLEGVNSGYSASVIDIYMDDLIKNLNEKIEKKIGQPYSGTSAIKINIKLDDLFKAFVAGEMTSTGATTEVYDSVMNYDFEEYEGKDLPYTPWEPFEGYDNDDFYEMMDNMKQSVEQTFLKAVELIPLEDLEAEVERRRDLNSSPDIKYIASAATEGASLKDAVASLHQSSNPTLKA